MRTPGRRGRCSAAARSRVFTGGRGCLLYTSRQRFLDIRKRAFKFPKLGQKAKLVAIPTTSGTGSEVTSFSVITDKQNGNIKYPLADYRLTPDVAIIDPQFTRSMPKSIVADTGLDVLTHAIEAYVSVMASDYTDGLALHAIEMVFTYLEKSYNGCLLYTSNCRSCPSSLRTAPPQAPARG